MAYYVGLDVSLKSTHICVMDQDRQVLWRGIADTQPSMIAERLKRWTGQLARVGLETESLTPWLYHALKDLGFPIICMDARRAADAVKARSEKTDKADAQALAEMLASGWYSAVHVKTMESHRLKALFGARAQLVNVKRQLYGQVRGLILPACRRFDSYQGGTVGWASCSVQTAAYAQRQLCALISVIDLVVAEIQKRTLSGRAP